VLNAIRSLEMDLQTANCIEQSSHGEEMERVKISADTKRLCFNMLRCYFSGKQTFIVRMGHEPDLRYCFLLRWFSYN
jgi:hypothetical protein